MTEHSKLMSPSASGLWLECTGQPQAKADAGVHNSSSPASDLGTLKHDYAERIKKGQWDVNTPAPDMDEAEWKDVPKALKMLDKALFNCSPSTKHWYELGVGFTEEWRKDCFGTVDIVSLDVVNKVLYVSDYKFGRGRVGAKHNTQLMIYALAVIAYLRSKGVDVDKLIGQVFLNIIQPKTSHEPDTFMIWKAGLEKWDENTLQPAQRAIVEGKGEFKSGPWCGTKYCELQKQNKCPLVLQETVNTMAQYEQLPEIEMEPIKTDGTLNDTEVKLLTMAKTLKAVIKSTQTKALALAEAGEEVPNHKLVKGGGSRDWVDQAKAETYLTNQKVKAEERWPKKFITAPQAETLLKKKGNFEKERSKARFNELVVYTEGANTLVHESDPREPVIFTDVEGDTDDLFGLLDTDIQSTVVKKEETLDDLFDML